MLSSYDITSGLGDGSGTSEEENSSRHEACDSIAVDALDDEKNDDDNDSDYHPNEESDDNDDNATAHLMTLTMSTPPQHPSRTLKLQEWMTT